MMKKLILLVLFNGLLNSAYCQYNWQQKANYPDSISYAVGFSIGSLGYLGLGWNQNVSQAFWSYNPENNQWLKVADFPVANFFEPFAMSINGEGYIGTGYENGSTYRKDFWKYSPQNDTWIRLKDINGLERTEATGFEINGKGYIGFGFNGNPNSYLKDWWEYTPSNDSWKRVANFPGVARIASTGFSINGKGYICSGVGTGFNYLNDLWEYDPQLDTWTQKASLPADKRMRACAFVIDNKGFFGTGVNNQRRYNDFWQYDPLTDTWTEQDPLDIKNRQNAVAFTINNRGYIGTGADVGLPYYNDFWLFSLATDTIQCIPKPKANFSVDDICETDSIKFLNNSQNANTYFWKFGDGNASNNKSPQYFYNINGVTTTFNVTLIASISSLCSDSVVKFVTVNANPNSDFNLTVNQNKVDFKATQGGLTSYKWFFGNGDSSSSKDVSYTYPNSGKFTACLKVENAANCFSITCKEVLANVGVGSVFNSQGYKIYPNPSFGSFTIEKTKNHENVTIEIFNQIGQLVHLAELKKDLNTMDLDLSNGVYLVRLTNGEHSLIQKMVVVK